MNYCSPQGRVFALSLRRCPPAGPPADLPRPRPLARGRGLGVRVEGSACHAHPMEAEAAGPPPGPPAAYRDPHARPRLESPANGRGSRPARRGDLAPRAASGSPVAHCSSHLRCGSRATRASGHGVPSGRRGGDRWQVNGPDPPPTCHGAGGDPDPAVRPSMGPARRRRGLGAQVAVTFQSWKRRGGTPASSPRGLSASLQPSTQAAGRGESPGSGVALQVEAPCRVLFCFTSG